VTGPASAQAERLSRKRAKALPAFAAIFIAQQASFFASETGRGRTVDHVPDVAWLVLTLVLLLALATGGRWIYSREVRLLANDESTRVHRDDAFRTGFVASMIACIAIYLIGMFDPLAEREVLHLVVTAGMTTALLRFGFLERRALRDG